MNENNRSLWATFIIIQFAVAVIFFMIYLKVFLQTEISLGKTIGEGVVIFYAGLSLVYLLAVYSTGIWTARRLGRKQNIRRAIAFSLLFWIIGLFVYTLTIGFFDPVPNSRILPMTIILVAIITGFNIGLAGKKLVKKTKNKTLHQRTL